MRPDFVVAVLDWDDASSAPLTSARASPTDSATMRQARWSSSAMASKYAGWGTALGRRAGENEVKRTAGSPG